MVVPGSHSPPLGKARDGSEEEVMAFKGPMVYLEPMGISAWPPALHHAGTLGSPRESRGSFYCPFSSTLYYLTLIRTLFFLKNTVFSDYEHRIVVEILEENRMKKL